jgi:hypothetical protein
MDGGHTNPCRLTGPLYRATKCGMKMCPESMIFLTQRGYMTLLDCMYYGCVDFSGILKIESSIGAFTSAFSTVNSISAIPLIF